MNIEKIKEDIIKDEYEIYTEGFSVYYNNIYDQVFDVIQEKIRYCSSFDVMRELNSLLRRDKIEI